MKIKIRNDEIPQEGKCRALLLSSGLEIALFRFQGKLYAIDNSCPHEGGPLAEGELDGPIISCPWHSWQFDIRDGSCQNLLCDGVPTYPVEVSSDGVFICIE